MKAICEDDLVIDCGGYKAIDTGVVLFDDQDEKNVVAFVPDEKLQYMLPDDVVEREHERLGLPAPEISSPEELESRLAAFADEIDDLREHLDRQVEDLIDEGATFDGDDLERQDRLRERRRTVDRLLQQVRQRAHQFQQLSTVEAEAGAGEEEVASAESEGFEMEEQTDADVESLRTEMDERFAAIEDQLQQLAAAGAETTEGAEVEAEAAEEAEAEQGDPLDEIGGLGPTYRRRLHDAGIDTLEGLAESDPETVADATRASQRRSGNWIEEANDRLEEQAASA